MSQPLRSGALFFGGFGPACHHRLHDGSWSRPAHEGTLPPLVGLAASGRSWLVSEIEGSAGLRC
ncbi:MAG: hypothetical protein ACJ8DD_22300, partial [Microvirga sp.]